MSFVEMMEVNVRNLFHDFNPSKFLVYSCLLVFSLLFALKLDNTVTWSFWVIFLPIWVWKATVIVGSLIGSWVWWRNPQYRVEGDAYIQYKAMVICTGLHLLLLMFEVLACDKLESQRRHVYWILVFIPLIFMSIVSIGICVWAVKNERSFELELFCSVNILQFIFLALRLDNFITWSWVIVFIPIWIVMCVALIGVLYAIILAIILIKSPDIIPEQRRGNVCSAIGYTGMVVPLLTFLILLANKLDVINRYTFVAVTVPLFISLSTLILLAFGSKGGNYWWFGIRKDFCPWLLGVCPLLQEYGNISIKMQPATQEPEEQTMDTRQTKKTGHSKKSSPIEESPKTVIKIMVLDEPD